MNDRIADVLDIKRWLRSDGTICLERAARMWTSHRSMRVTNVNLRDSNTRCATLESYLFGEAAHSVFRYGVRQRVRPW